MADEVRFAKLVRGLFETREALGEGVLAVWGAPYDGTTSFRPGARFGPEAIRSASHGLETYCPVAGVDVEEDVAVCDLGDLEVTFGSPEPVIARVRAATRHVLSAGAVPVMLGGEHSLTAGAVEAVAERWPEVAVVQLDAHADLRPEYLGERYSHACAMRRCLDVLEAGAMVQVGIRSGTRDEFDELRSTGRWVAPTPEALTGALQALGDRPLYVTCDLDVFDPACFPGTGTPEPGGIDWATFSALWGVIPARRVVGVDLMELAPQLDPSGCSSVLAAKALREVLVRLGAR